MDGNAVEYLKTNVNVEELLRFYNAQRISIHGRDIRCCCPIHKGNNPTAFVFNLNNNLWYCHTGNCGGGDIYDFVMQMEHVEFIPAVRRIAEIFNIDISQMEITIRANQILMDTKRWIAMMQTLTKKTEYKPYDIMQLGVLYPINSYRNFNKYTLQEFDIKYCKNNHRIVVPIYQKSILVGVTMRRTDNHPIKWLHQPAGLTTGNYLYNIDNMVKGQPIILCEGVWDVLNYYQHGYMNAVASFGCHLTAEQERLLMQSTYSILISYDMDKAGITGINDIIDRMKYKMNIKIAKIPFGKDAGELSADEINDAISESMDIHEWRKR